MEFQDSEPSDFNSEQTGQKKDLAFNGENITDQIFHQSFLEMNGKITHVAHLDFEKMREVLRFKSVVLMKPDSGVFYILKLEAHSGFIVKWKFKTEEFKYSKFLRKDFNTYFYSQEDLPDPNSWSTENTPVTAVVNDLELLFEEGFQAIATDQAEDLVIQFLTQTDLKRYNKIVGIFQNLLNQNQLLKDLNLTEKQLKSFLLYFFDIILLEHKLEENWSNKDQDLQSGVLLTAFNDHILSNGEVITSDSVLKYLQDGYTLSIPNSSSFTEYSVIYRDEEGVFRNKIINLRKGVVESSVKISSDELLSMANCYEQFMVLPENVAHRFKSI